MADLSVNIYGDQVAIKGVEMKNVDKVIDLVDKMSLDGAEVETILKRVARYQTMNEDGSRVEPKKAAAKRGKGDNNAKRARALEIVAEMAGQPNGDIVKAIQKELDISYANAYYYIGVAAKAAKAAKPAAKAAKPKAKKGSKKNKAA